MNMTLTFPNGSQALILQQQNGEFTIIIREAHTALVLDVLVDQPRALVIMYHNKALAIGGRAKLECVL